MFETLQEKFERVFKTLRLEGALSEKSLDETLREVRLALLEADVNFKVVKELVGRIRVRALGEVVQEGLTPAQEVVRIVRDELVGLLGRDTSELIYSSELPSVFLLVGLQGSGKTTTTGKMARWLEKKGKRPMVVSTDVRRPAAREQLAVIAGQVGVPCFSDDRLGHPLELAQAARKDAADRGHDVLLVDSAGRLHVEDKLMQELSELRTELRPSEILFVADTMMGQDAVNSAQQFHARLGITGVILTKLDGDARGGAALSIHHVTGQPIKFVGVGEGYDTLETFHPERMVSRILGMGDVLSLIEKAESTLDKKKALDLERKVRTNSFTLEDFRDQMKQLRSMGPLDQVLGMLPRWGPMKNLNKVRVEEKQIIRIEAIIGSMTPQERDNHHLINGKRRKRIARGSGTTVQQVNQLLKQFVQMRKMMKSMTQGMSRNLARMNLPLGGGPRLG
jgi:signal recognition particle subunit SRP54